MCDYIDADDYTSPFFSFSRQISQHFSYRSMLFLHNSKFTVELDTKDFVVGKLAMHF